MNVPPILRPLASRNYRLFFTGQTVSLLGTWMSQTASLWLVYHLSSSAFLLGVVGFVSQVPAFVLGPVAGVWVDRVNRHKMLIATQALYAIQTLALAGFVLTGTVRVGHIIALSLFQGVIGAFDAPARQSLVVAFVDRKEFLGRAIALNSSMVNLARLIGPAVAGAVIAAWGAGLCYVIDGISYVAVIASLLMMRLAASPPPSSGSKRAEFREGLKYAFGFLPIRAMLQLVAIVSFAAFPYITLMPVFASDILHGDARTLGLLMSASGLGAFVGAVALGSRRSGHGFGRVITYGGAMMGSALVLFPLTAWLPASLLLVAAVGAGGVLILAAGNTVVQTMVDDDKRGRVMSLYATSFLGISPFGNLAVGALAHGIGARITLVLCGLATLAGIYAFSRRLPAIRAAAEPVMHRFDALHEEMMR